MLRIVPCSTEHAAGVISVILPIQQAEFGIPISLDAQPDLTKNGLRELARDALPESFPVMGVDSKFYELWLHRDEA